MKYEEFGIRSSLNAETIDNISDKATAFLTSTKLDKKEKMRIRLTIEDILLKWQQRFGENAHIKASGFSHLGQPTIKLMLQEEPFDPLTDGNDELSGTWSGKLLSGLQTTPVYSYNKNTNEVTFKLIRPKMSPIIPLLIAIAAAAIVGLVGDALIPTDITSKITDQFLTPVCTTYFGVLDFCGIPLIFLSVALGICGVGDAKFFGKIGKKMISHFGLSLLLSTLIAIIALPFFDYTFTNDAVGFAFKDVLEMILGFLPTSLVKPFIDCNAMQLIILGLVFGIGILKLDPLMNKLSGVLEDLNSLLLFVSQLFTRIIPFFVFCILIKGVWSGGIKQMLTAWKPWVLTTLLQVIFMAIVIAQICLKNKVKLKTLLKKISATFLISLGTNSCCATIPELYAASSNLGVSPKVMSFGIPIGTSIYKPATAIRFIVISFFMVSTLHVDISIPWIILTVLTSMLLSIAVPAIPGGALLFYPMLFTQLGIPSEALSIMLAVDIFFDNICTAFCQVSAELALVQQASNLGLLDKEQLCKE